ncbi:DUF1365 domain-containing protein [Salinivibrio socompensis]|uniref:DUF1365 domain-containing protein n=1 Tax=Salinivibrio socompensis TaxID=1510206 RepID=UPI0004B41858|nr:DUF1365 family protein [Salinivibrio socompensis]
MSESVVPLNSGLYVGQVRHRRYTPIKHMFSYPVFMPLIDLDELALLSSQVTGFRLGKWGWAAFDYRDYLDGREDTKTACLDKVHALTGERIEGKVYALCQLRYLGVYFSPANFYYVYDQDNNWRYVLAEVSNTPWGERFYYAVPAGKRWENDKAFHVSPFNPIEQRYYWRLRPLGERVHLHLEAHREIKEFDATLGLQRRPFTSKTLGKLLIRTPIETVKVLIGIYWQALKLWIKGAPFYPHPGAKKE